MKEKRMIIGVSGASGAPVAVELLRALAETEFESHLILTRGGEMTALQETGMTAAEFSALADVVYDVADVGAAPASGSFRSAGMIVVPCSMKTLAGINCGYSDNLLLRAADVTLKEGRPLMLVARECPLSAIHLRNMYELSQAGAVIMPPVLSYYNRPETLEDATRHIVGKILDRFGVDYAAYKRWEGR